MIKKLVLPGFEGQKIEVDTGKFIQRPALLVDGEPVHEGFWGGRFTFSKKDGTRAKGRWKPEMFGLDVPQLEIEGVCYRVVDRLPLYIVYWCALPVLLCMKDLIWGTLFGLMGFSINLYAFHGEWKQWQKFLLTGAITIGWVILFIIFGPIFSTTAAPK
jgi:hypothetical protein